MKILFLIFKNLISTYALAVFIKSYRISLIFLARHTTRFYMCIFGEIWRQIRQFSEIGLSRFIGISDIRKRLHYWITNTSMGIFISKSQTYLLFLNASRLENNKFFSSFILCWFIYDGSLTSQGYNKFHQIKILLYLFIMLKGLK